MLHDPRVTESLRHVKSASAVLREADAADAAPKAGARAAVLEHLEAARQALDILHAPDGLASSQLRSRRRSELTDRILSLLPFLTAQMSDTIRELGPLRPAGDRGPLRRVDDVDIEAALSALRRLQRQATELESALRRLQRQASGLPKN